MNCPSRVDENASLEGHYQNPPFLAADTTTQADLNNIVRHSNRGLGTDAASDKSSTRYVTGLNTKPGLPQRRYSSSTPGRSGVAAKGTSQVPSVATSLGEHEVARKQPRQRICAFLSRARYGILNYARFVGPGFIISVSYMDPGNYSTDVGAGAQFRYSHLFVILLSNIFAMLLQSLCIRLGVVTTMDLAQNCRAHLPRWLSLTLYALAESAIIATDLAEVIGIAIALNILLHIPLVAGVAISIVDVLVVLVLYRPNKSLRSLRFFELAVSLLVFGVVICFAIELARMPPSSAKDIFRGYIPSATIARGDGLYLSCGILGATVMPHSLYLGSGIVQPRVRDIDLRRGNPVPDVDTPGEEKYLPSLPAINQAIKYSIIDLLISLTSCALFANSAILIVSASALYNTPAAQDADLFGIHDLLSDTIGKGAGLIFALALLFSGQSSGVVVTLAGQLVSEGFLNWKLRPWLRRLITRGVAITPCIVVAAAVGRSGLGAVLNASQVTLSILLPFVTAPLVWFTCRKGYMMCGEKDLKSGWVVTVLAVVTWVFITFLNIVLIVELGLGKT